MPNANEMPDGPTPGARTPGATMPGPEEPDDSAVTELRVSSTGVAIDATGTTTIGTPSGRVGEVRAVIVDATAADFDFNVTEDGTAIFSAAQSPSGTSEEFFFPDAEARHFEDDAGSIVLDVTSASATGGATVDVTVVVAVAEETA